MSHGFETLHVFYNDYSFLDLEESYVKKGGAYGSKTLYMFREKKANDEEEDGDNNNGTSKVSEGEWQLTAVASTYKANKPGVYANLGHTFTTID